MFTTKDKYLFSASNTTEKQGWISTLKECLKNLLKVEDRPELLEIPEHFTSFTDLITKEDDRLKEIEKKATEATFMVFDEEGFF